MSETTRKIAIVGGRTYCMPAYYDESAIDAEDLRSDGGITWIVGERVEGGTGEDHDTGRVIDDHGDGTVMVAWDSHVTTPAPVAILRALGCRDAGSRG